MALLVALWSSDSLSQEGGNVHWALAAYFGTGAYQVSDTRDVYVVRPTPRWNLRGDSSATEPSLEPLWRLRVPVAVGLHQFDFDDINGVVDPDNLASVSLVPGVELILRPDRRWTIGAFANLGWGSLTNGDESAWTYWGGIKSSFQLPSIGKLDWQLINAVSYVGYSPENDRQEDMLPLMAGLELAYPLPERWTLRGDQLQLNLHGTYTYYEKEMDFVVQRRTLEQVKDAWEFGIGLSKDNKAFELWSFEFDRVGVGFAESGTGVRGIKLYFRSVFDYL